MSRPYSALSLIYDRLLGDSFIPLLERNFEWLTQRYPIRLDSVADVACGTGTFVKYLCDRGIPQVIGVDRSAEMLEIARRKNCRNQARFLHQDFLHLELPAPVSLITSNFDSLNYLLEPEQLVAAFRKFRANLEPGGFTVFDMITPNQPWQSQNPIIERRRMGVVDFFRSMRLDEQTGLQHSKVIMSSPAGVAHETHFQRAYPSALVLKLLRRARFCLSGLLDFADLSPADGSSRRIIVIALRV